MQSRWMLLLALGTLVGSSPAATAQTAEPVPSLVMVGEAEQVGTPDLALVTLGVTRDGKTASQALRATTQAMRNVLDAVRKHGVESRDIQTSGLSVQPRYERPQRPGGDDRAIVAGYSASNQLSLRARRLESLGELLDDVVAAGANEIRGLSFDVADRAKLLDEARIRAVEDAKRKATLYADAAGIRLGVIINLQEESADHEPRPMAARAGQMQSAAPVPIEAGEITLRTRVRMTWRIAN